MPRDLEPFPPASNASISEWGGNGTHLSHRETLIHIARVAGKGWRDGDLSVLGLIVGVVGSHLGMTPTEIDTA